MQTVKLKAIVTELSGNSIRINNNPIAVLDYSKLDDNLLVVNYLVTDWHNNTPIEITIREEVIGFMGVINGSKIVNGCENNQVLSMYISNLFRKTSDNPNTKIGIYFKEGIKDSFKYVLEDNKIDNLTKDNYCYIGCNSPQVFSELESFINEEDIVYINYNNTIYKYTDGSLVSCSLVDIPNTLHHVHVMKGVIYGKTFISK